MKKLRRNIKRVLFLRREKFGFIWMKMELGFSGGETGLISGL